MEENYQQSQKNKKLIFGLAAVAGVLLLALVGVLAYNFGKNTDKDKDSSSEMVESSESDDASSDFDEMAVSRMPPPEAHARPAVDARSLSNLHLVGTIAGQGVDVDLYNDDGDLSGSYYYTRYGDKGKLELYGTMDGNGNVYLEEYNVERGYETAYIEGHLSHDGHLTGSFTNVDRGGTYNVNLNLE